MRCENSYMLCMNTLVEEHTFRFTLVNTVAKLHLCSFPIKLKKKKSAKNFFSINNKARNMYTYICTYCCYMSSVITQKALDGQRPRRIGSTSLRFGNKPQNF